MMCIYFFILKNQYNICRMLNAYTIMIVKKFKSINVLLIMNIFMVKISPDIVHVKKFTKYHFRAKNISYHC